MDIVYNMITTEETDAWGRTYIGYGIEEWRISHDGMRTRLHRVPDLFSDRAQCESFVRMCNEEEVAPFHLLEVIDNLLADGVL